MKHESDVAIMNTQRTIFNETDDSGPTAAGDGRRIGDRISTRMQTAAAKVGDQMHSVAGAIRDTEPRIDSAVHSGVERVAQVLERGAGYFAERHYEETIGKATRYIRRHPVMSIAIGLGAGLLFASRRRW
jgi:ElaB/YqjD/DUF883 family membrane-anchored ribosome-binding protein